MEMCLDCNLQVPSHPCQGSEHFNHFTSLKGTFCPKLSKAWFTCVEWGRLGWLVHFEYFERHTAVENTISNLAKCQSFIPEHHLASCTWFNQKEGRKNMQKHHFLHSSLVLEESQSSLEDMHNPICGINWLKFVTLITAPDWINVTKSNTASKALEALLHFLHTDQSEAKSCK